MEKENSYSAIVIDGIKRKSRSYLRDSVDGKYDTRMNKKEHVVVCLPDRACENG